MVALSFKLRNTSPSPTSSWIHNAPSPPHQRQEALDLPHVALSLVASAHHLRRHVRVLPCTRACERVSTQMYVCVCVCSLPPPLCGIGSSRVGRKHFQAGDEGHFPHPPCCAPPQIGAWLEASCNSWKWGLSIGTISNRDGGADPTRLKQAAPPTLHAVLRLK